MATGRDDFVIAFRSAFLKKKDKQKFSLFSLILLSIIVIILSNINDVCGFLMLKVLYVLFPYEIHVQTQICLFFRALRISIWACLVVCREIQKPSAAEPVGVRETFMCDSMLTSFNTSSFIPNNRSLNLH